MELANVLNDWSYVGGGETERRRLIYARLRARKLIHWTFDQWQLFDEQNNPIDAKEQFFWPYFTQQARALILYKKTALDCGVKHTEIPHLCTLKKVENLVEQAVMTHESPWKMYCTSDSEDITFAWTGTWFTVSKHTNPMQSKYMAHKLIPGCLSTFKGDYDKIAKEGYTIDDGHALGSI
jgi:hypothetical protein